MSNLPTPAFMFKWIRSLLGCRCRHRDGGGLEEPEPEEALTQSSEASRSPSSNNSEDSSYSVPEQPESAQLLVLATTSALGPPLTGGPSVFVIPSGGQQLGCRQLTPNQFDLNHPELRVYSVWSIPGWGERFTGIHWSIGLVAYRGLLELNDGQFAGIRWRRANSLDQAVTLFLAEADRFHLGTDHISVHGWSVVEIVGRDSRSWSIVNDQPGVRPFCWAFPTDGCSS